MAGDKKLTELPEGTNPDWLYSTEGGNSRKVSPDSVADRAKRVKYVADITELRGLALNNNQIINLSEDGSGRAGNYIIQVSAAPESLPDVIVLDDGKRAILQPVASNVISAISQAEAEANNYTDSVIAGISGGASVYADTTAGLAATSEGEYFNVPSTEEDELLILYLHDTGGVATEIGGSPSAVGVANAMDVTENASRVVVSSNLFDLGVATDGKRVRTADGTLYNGASYTVSDYIPVDASTSYTWAHSSQYAVYDSSKNFIEGGAANNLTTGASGAFVRYDMRTSNVGTSMFAKTSEYPSFYEPYETGVDFSDLVYDPS